MNCFKSQFAFDINNEPFLQLDPIQNRAETMKSTFTTCDDYPLYEDPDEIQVQTYLTNSIYFFLVLPQTSVNYPEKTRTCI